MMVFKVRSPTFRPEGGPDAEHGDLTIQIFTAHDREGMWEMGRIATVLRDLADELEAG